ncbi:N-terminal EF-hand calcium-binding protein 1 [Dissostichus eleginoides]|uniref:N-terminal EF-hand calcium-binding protein 1 n=1 Tax=Dissostichus eleginoides TaxID=100907 RepID=A0AAD9ET48_DISEL|nr:N-terminal EF-hand calcium-binding protein 1 [Dissostichus eleginoides]
MDCSEEVQAVFEEPTAEMELKKGMSIFIDILRRADKNDDGKLSFDEFKSYFSDGVLTAEELQELFHTIDTHNTEGLVLSACISEGANLVSVADVEEQEFLKSVILSNIAGITYGAWIGGYDAIMEDNWKWSDGSAFTFAAWGAGEPNDANGENCMEMQTEYFSQHLGEYENVLGALEDLNMCILKAMDKTKKDYQESSHLEQFVTRFLLKETTNQLHSLQSSLECAMETTAEQTRQEKQGPLKPEVLSIQWSGRRSNRRLQRNSSLSPNNPLLSLVNSGGCRRLKELLGQSQWVSTGQRAEHRRGEGGRECLREKLECVYEEDSQWMVQVNRLQRLIDRLEKKEIRLEPVEEEVLESKSHILIVQRQLSVLEDELEEFRLALRQYMDCACAQTGCLHIAVQRLANESRFILYEFWEHNSVWKNHLQTNYSKTFQRGNVDFLETPESLSTMLVPASWWVLNNNN